MYTIQDLDLASINIEDCSQHTALLLKRLKTFEFECLSMNTSSLTFPYPYPLEMYAEFLSSMALEVSSRNYLELNETQKFLNSRGIEMFMAKISFSRAQPGYIKYRFYKRYDSDCFNESNSFCFVWA